MIPIFLILCVFYSVNWQAWFQSFLLSRWKSKFRLQFFSTTESASFVCLRILICSLTTQSCGFFSLSGETVVNPMPDVIQFIRNRAVCEQFFFESFIRLSFSAMGILLATVSSQSLRLKCERVRLFLIFRWTQQSTLFNQFSSFGFFGCKFVNNSVVTQKYDICRRMLILYWKACYLFGRSA
jgi:hypothetical protein